MESIAEHYQSFMKELNEVKKNQITVNSDNGGDNCSTLAGTPSIGSSKKEIQTLVGLIYNIFIPCYGVVSRVTVCVSSSFHGGAINSNYYHTERY